MKYTEMLPDARNKTKFKNCVFMDIVTGLCIVGLRCLLFILGADNVIQSV